MITHGRNLNYYDSPHHLVHSIMRLPIDIRGQDRRLHDVEPFIDLLSYVDYRYDVTLSQFIR